MCKQRWVRLAERVEAEFWTLAGCVLCLFCFQKLWCSHLLQWVLSPCGLRKWVSWREEVVVVHAEAFFGSSCWSLLILWSSFMDMIPRSKMVPLDDHALPATQLEITKPCFDLKFSSLSFIHQSHHSCLLPPSQSDTYLSVSDLRCRHACNAGVSGCKGECVQVLCADVHWVLGDCKTPVPTCTELHPVQHLEKLLESEK